MKGVPEKQSYRGCLYCAFEWNENHKCCPSCKHSNDDEPSFGEACMSCGENFSRWEFQYSYLGEDK